MAALTLAGCASPQLQDTTSRIDLLEQELSAPPPPIATGNAGAIGPPQLLASAESRGKDFMRARISRARAMLALDQVKSERLPRFSAEARRSSTYTGDDLANLASVSNVVLGVNWDISKALLKLDHSTVDVAGRLIPVQYQIAQKTAMSNLLSAYDAYTKVDFRRQSVALRAKGLQCRIDAEEKVDPGERRSERELAAMRDQIAAVRREEKAVVRSLNAKRDTLLGLAGLAEGGYEVEPAGSMLAALPDYRSLPTANAEACFASSGKKRLEDLLVAAADAQLGLARQSRFTKLKTSIPSFMTQAGGLNLQFLVSYVLPLIDEGDALRLTQNARLTLMETILSAQDNRRAFMNDFDTLKLSIAAADSDLAAARSSLARAEAKNGDAAPDQQCLAAVELEKAKSELAAARFKIDMLKSRLNLLCAPLSEETADLTGSSG
ncbi:hypothetical protein [Martelella limonii]|uniref:hypothetical protein n=1 Tax=Martelella limonii TaxID=1647649 RepID=UPI001580ADA6|nr:hypothetical protein [Martelella limonii]